MSLLDILQPKAPPQPKDVRVVQRDGTYSPERVENQKREQRKHWRENDRRKK